MQTSDFAQSKYNVRPIQGAVTSDFGAAVNGSVNTAGVTANLSAQSPMLVLLAIGAATLGLVAFSTSARVGKFHAEVGAG